MKNLLSNWITSAKRSRYSWTAFYVFVGLIIGLFAIIRFSIAKCINFSSLLLWASAFFSVGGLLGFLYSVPKIISDNPPNPSDVAQTTNRLVRRRIEENTNLIQISDWLTKTILGASLVQLKDAPGFILKLSRTIAMGIRPKPMNISTIDSFTIMSAAVIGFFTSWGFISGYLIMKLVLTEQFAGINSDLVSDDTGESEGQDKSVEGSNSDNNS